MPGSRCKRCRLRWPQSRGLCRKCWRELGDVRTVQDFDRERLAYQQRQRVQVDLTPRPDKVVTVDGIDYEVVWDGS